MIRTVLHKHHCEVFINISVYIQQTSHSFSKAYVCFLKTYAIIFHPSQAQAIDYAILDGKHKNRLQYGLEHFELSY